MPQACFLNALTVLEEIICAAYRAVRTTLAARRELPCNFPKFRYISIQKSSVHAGLVCDIVGRGDHRSSVKKTNFCRGRRPRRPVFYSGSICKDPRLPIYFLPFLWYNLTNR